MNPFDEFVAATIAACCNNCGSMPVATLAGIVALVGRTGSRPHGLRGSLERLGYQVRSDQIVGISPKSVAHFVRPFAGEHVEINDVLESLPAGVGRRYARHVLESLPSEGGTLHHTTLI